MNVRLLQSYMSAEALRNCYADRKQQRGCTIYSVCYRMSKTITCRYTGVANSGFPHHNHSFVASGRYDGPDAPAKQGFLAMLIMCIGKLH